MSYEYFGKSTQLIELQDNRRVWIASNLLIAKFISCKIIIEELCNETGVPGKHQLYNEIIVNWSLVWDALWHGDCKIIARLNDKMPGWT